MACFICALQASDDDDDDDDINITPKLAETTVRYRLYGN